MLPKNVLIALLGAAAAAEASVISFESPATSKLTRRQGGGGFRGGNRFGGGNNNQNQDQNQQDQNQDQNQGQNQQDQNQDQNQQDQNQQDQNQDQNQQDQNQDQNQQDNGDNANQNNELCLDPNNVQEGSQSDGQQGGGDPEQAPSATDNANFINFCTGKTLTNGVQVEGGSCNGIAMGDIPAKNRMISSVFLSPANGEVVAENQDFDITVFTSNLAAGRFTEPQSTYYAAPQALDGGGNIIGHTHITVQDTGSSDNPQQPLDPSQFAFFKGVNDDGDGQGRLSATVTGGLPAGNYRVCSMTAAANHQPVLMPVAQRGAQDDCIRFSVGGNGGGGNDNGGGNNNSGSAADGNEGAQDANDGGDQNNGNQDQNQDGGNGGGNNNDNDNNNNQDGGDGAGAQDAGNQGGGGGGGEGGATSANALGGIAAPEVTDSGNSDRPFAVNGNTFVNKSAAVERACAIQNNSCADAVNGGQLNGVSVGDCGSQISKCQTELA